MNDMERNNIEYSIEINQVYFKSKLHFHSEHL